MPKGGGRAGWLARCAVVLSLGVQVAPSQQPVSPADALPADVRAALQDLAGQAEVIFAGQVESVTHGGAEGAGGYVDVRFRVERAMRGCGADEVYTVREWAGVWAAHAERYRVGRRLLMLLTAPGKAGLSSPVGGQDGAIPLLTTVSGPLWTATGGAEADSMTAGDRTDALVPDLRWVQARATRVVKPGTARGADSASWTGAAPVLTLRSARAAALVRLRDVTPLLRQEERGARAAR